MAGHWFTARRAVIGLLILVAAALVVATTGVADGFAGAVTTPWWCVIFRCGS